MTNLREVLEHYRSEWEHKVRNLEPGPELDALVAEKVLGLIKDDVDRNLFKTAPRRYSTDIAAAWEAWEYKRQENWTMNILSPRKGIYKAEIIEHTESGVRWLGIGYGETVAEAMVKCRLLAVMEKEDEQ